MFKDIGKQIIVNWQLWKLLVRVYPLILLVAYAILFYMPNMAGQSSIDGNQMIKSQITHTLGDKFKEMTESFYGSAKLADSLPDYIVAKFAQFGLQTYVQETEERNIIGRLRARRSPNYECFVISFDYGPEKLRSVAFVLNLIHYFSSEEVNYLSKDIIFVGVDTNQKRYGRGIKAFLSEYINPKTISRMPRSGTIRQSLHINLDDKFDTVALKVFGLNGRVPDRDFFSNINNLMESSGLKYQYTETNYSYLKAAERKIQESASQIWDLLQLNQLFLFSKRFISIYPFYGHVLDSVQGDVHEAHPYYLELGVHSLTIRGFSKSKTSEKNDQINICKTLSTVIEGSVRSYMATDEFLHAGSTLYLPVGFATSLTIQTYVLPLALLLAAYVIPNLKNFLERWQYNVYKEDRDALKSAYSSSILNEVLRLLMGLILCFTHQITAWLISKFGLPNSHYNVYITVAGLIVLTQYIARVVFKFYFLDIVWREPRSQAKLDLERFFIGVMQGLALIYAAIINISIGCVMAIILGPWMITIQPLRPQPCFAKSSIVGYIVNLIFLYLLATSVIEYNAPILNYLWDIVENYRHVEVEAFYYINVVLVPFCVRLLDILLF